MIAKCSYCNAELNGCSVDNMHPLCYEINHPFRSKETFMGVLTNLEDQVIVRELLNKYLSQESKDMIIEEFNSIMAERYRRRVFDLLDTEI